MKRLVVACASLSCFSLTLPAFAEPVTSITQYGITWTFDKAYESGTYASGDYWVVGPVTVTHVSPAPTGTRHGSCVNPQPGRQGYDSRGGKYETDDNVSFPYTLKVDESLVSSVSKPDGAEIKNVGALNAQAVLTAVAAPQPSTALRPSYAGTYKAKLFTDAIDWTLLPNLAPPASKPNGPSLLAMAERPRIDHLGSWTIQNSCAEENWNNGAGAHACYGREYSAFVSSAAQYVMLDTPERDELVISMIQLGIDNFGVLEAGGGWPADGGHHSSRKWPIVLAAVLLNDCDMLRVGEDFDPSRFGEDGQTYYGTSGKALWGKTCSDPGYFTSGCSGGGSKDCRDPEGLVDGCDDYRNCCTSAYWVGQMLSAKMLHAEAVWNHDAYFDYVDRWMSGDVEGGGSAASDFIKDMWTQYRDAVPPGTAVSSTCTPGRGGAGGSSGSAGSAGTSGGAGSNNGGNAGNAGDGGTSGSSAGGTSSGGVNGNNDADGAGAGEGDAGCGCQLTSRTPSHIAWLAAIVAVCVARRRSSIQRAARSR